LLLNYHNLCPQCTQWLRHDATSDSGINDQLINITALIRGLNVFWAYQSAILLSAIFSVNILYYKIINSHGPLCGIDNEKW